MTGSNQDEDEVYQFILENIDSVPHLEAWLLCGTRGLKIGHPRT